MNKQMLISIVTAVTLSACTNINKNVTQSSSTVNPTENTNPTASTTEQPSTSVIATSKPISTGTISVKTYTNAKEGYEIRYPASWYQRSGFESTIGSSEYYISNENVKYTDLSKDGVYLIIKRDNATEAPENDPVKNFNALYKDQNHTNITIAGTQAIKIISENEFDAGSTGDSSKRIIRYALMHNNKIYVLEFRSKYNAAITNNESTFDSIAQSFKFTK